MKSSRKISVILLAVVMAMLFAQIVAAAQLDVSVKYDKVGLYEADDTVSITGSVYTPMPSHLAVNGATVTATVRYSNGSTIHFESVPSSSDGSYVLTPFVVPVEDTYNVQVMAMYQGSMGFANGMFIVDPATEYTLTTDRFTYSTNETVTITLIVMNVLSDGSKVPPSSEKTVSIKVKKKDGTAVKTIDVTTVNGTATTTYFIPINNSAYTDYTVTAGAALAVAAFEVPPFTLKTDLQGDNGKSKDVYSTSDSMILQSIVTLTTGTGAVVPVKGAAVLATIKKLDGTLMKTFSSSDFSETADGVYQSGVYSLANLTNGEYRVNIDVTKGGLTKSDSKTLNVKSLKMDLTHIYEKEGVMGFLKNKNATLGLYIMDMTTGNQISGDQITNVTITACKDEAGKDCMSLLQTNGSLKSVNDKDVSKAISFIAPNKTGNYIINVKATTSTKGTVSADTFLPVQNVILFADTTDEFGWMKWDFGPGEAVQFNVYGYSGDWEPVTVNRVSLVEVRNDAWADVTAQFSYNSTDSDSVRISWKNTSISQPSGWYNVKILANTTGGSGYAGAGYKVKLYSIWIDPLDVDGNWKWRFSSSDTVYLHTYAATLGGTQLDADDFTISIESLTNEMTRQSYTSLNTESNGTDSMGKPVTKLKLSGLGLTSGFYRAQVKITDTDGNRDYAESWFQVSNLDTWVNVKDANGAWKWQFGPTDNVSLEVHAQYFNGTPVPDGSNVTVNSLMLMNMGPPVPVPTSTFQSSSSLTSNGQATVWLKNQAGKKLPQGFLQALVNIRALDSANTSDNAEGWFQVALMNAWGYAQQWIVSSGSNVSIIVSVQKTDGTPLANATVSLQQIMDSNTWSPTSYEVSAVPSVSSDSNGYATLSFPAPGSNGQYEAKLKIYSGELGATSETQVWFSVQDYQIYGSLKDQSKTTYSPGANVELQIQVSYPDGTAASGKNVSIYKFANTEGWPWKYVDATTVTPGITDTFGLATVTVKAPSTTGYYNPLTRVGNVNSTDTWAVQGFEVKSMAVNVNLYDSQYVMTDQFTPNSTINVNVNVENPAGGTLNIQEITLVKYQDLDTMEETTLGTKKTPGSGVLSANLSFTSPTDIGEYVLFVSAKNNATQNVVISKRWFRVQPLSFDFWVWMDRWSYSPGDNVTINGEAWQNGNPVEVAVDAVSLRDSWTWNEVATDEEMAPGTIDGRGTYNFTAPSESKEYEVELCAYPVGEECTEWSERRWMHFAVESFELWAWPERGTFTPSEDVEISIKIPPEPGLDPTTYSAQFISLQDTKSWKDVSQYVGDVEEDNITTEPWNQRKIMRFSAAQMPAGEYEARFRVNKAGEERDARVWFRVSSFNMYLDTVPSTKFADRKFGMDDPITFNISISVTAAEDYNGTLELRNDWNWDLLAEYNFTIPQGETTAFVNVTAPDAGNYNVRARTDSAEEHFWFYVTAFDLQMLWEQCSHEIGADDEVHVAFDLMPDSGLNVTVKSLRNSWDWSVVPGTENMYSEELGVGTEAFDFDPNVNQGQYEAELEFQVGDKTLTQWLWFNIKSKDFWAWTENYNYGPGQDVRVWSYIAYPNGTPMSGQQVSVERVVNMATWMDVPVTGTMTNSTDQYGNAVIQFTMPANATGKFEVKLNETDGAKTNTQFNIGAYDVWMERTDWRWIFTCGENYEADVVVQDTDRRGVSGVGVTYSIYYDYDWQTPVNDSFDAVDAGTTDSKGKRHLSVPVPCENGHYRMLVDIGDGAATREEWFSVESFNVKSWVRGEDSSGDSKNSDQIGGGDFVVVSVDVMTGSDEPIVNASVSFMELRDTMGWIPVAAPTLVTDNQSTNEDGRAEIRFYAPNDTGDYMARVNVTYGGDEVISDSWFRITPYSFDADFICDPELGNVSYCDADSKGPGERMYINVSGSGETTNVKACLYGVQNIYNWNYVGYYECEEFDNGEVIIEFDAPWQPGQYEAQVELYKTGSGWDEYITGMRPWFEVLGSVSDYEMNTWTEQFNVWSGQNATIRVELWDRNGWGNADEEDVCGDLEIAEMRNSWTWETVQYDESKVSVEWDECGQGGPCNGMSGAALTFEVPNASSGEYQVKVRCVGEDLVRESWFRISSFQVSSLMPEVVRIKQNISWWVKVAGADGTPKAGINVTMRDLMDNWNWQTIKTYDQIFTTDANGEIHGSITAPDHPGEYSLNLVADDGHGTIQNINRWFRIKGLDVDVDFGGITTYYTGDTVTISVLVKDPLTQRPVSGANVNMNIMSHCFDKGASQEEEEENCWSYYDNSTCLENNCSWITDDYGSWCTNAKEAACIAYDGDQTACENDEDCFYDTWSGSCWMDYSQDSGSIECGGSSMEYGTTAYDGTVTFSFAGQNALAKGEYECSIDVNTPMQGWAWTSKSFTVKAFNVSGDTNGLAYTNGDTVILNVTARYKNGTPLPDGSLLEAGIEDMMFGKGPDMGGGYGGNMMDCAMMSYDQYMCETTMGCAWLDAGFDSQCLGEDEYYCVSNYDGDSSGCTADANCTWELDDFMQEYHCAAMPEYVEECGELPGEMMCEDTLNCYWWAEEYECLDEKDAYCLETFDGQEALCNADANCTWSDCLDACAAILVDEIEECTTVNNGVASLEFTIPANMSSGAKVLWADIEDADTELTEFLDLLLVVQGADSSYDVIVPSGVPVVNAGKLIEVEINTTKAGMSLAPFAMHLEKVGNGISMNQMMGGGSESGKEDWYESPIYFEPDNSVHSAILARDRKASFFAMVPIITKGSQWYGPEDFDDVVFIEYKVNSTTGQCRKDAQCSDNNNLTVDKCVFYECVYRNLSQINLSNGECWRDDQCNTDNDTNTIEACWNFRCEFIQDSECQYDYECNDNDGQTVDMCVNYRCEYKSSSHLDCIADSDCNDNNLNTYDSCDYGVCNYVDKSTVECTSDSQCYDNDSLTFDWCDSYSYTCVHNQEGVGCWSDWDCNDNNSATINRCDYGQCVFINSSLFECTQDADCVDNVTESYDFCDMGYGKCVHNFNTECNQENAYLECDDYDPATYDYCNSGMCAHIGYGFVQCWSDYDCDNGMGLCEDFQCFFPQAECEDDWDCDDSDPETFDLCDRGMCKFEEAGEVMFEYNQSHLWNLNWSLEMYDEQPQGNPAADIVKVKSADNSYYVYLQLGLGGLNMWNGGVPACGGTYRTNVTEMNISVYLDTISGEGDASYNDADYMMHFEFDGGWPYSRVYEYDGTWVGTDTWLDWELDCSLATLDIAVYKDNVNISLDEAIGIRARVYNNIGTADYAPNAGMYSYVADASDLDEDWGNCPEGMVDDQCFCGGVFTDEPMWCCNSTFQTEACGGGGLYPDCYPEHLSEMGQALESCWCGSTLATTGQYCCGEDNVQGVPCGPPPGS